MPGRVSSVDGSASNASRRPAATASAPWRRPGAGPPGVGTLVLPPAPCGPYFQPAGASAPRTIAERQLLDADLAPVGVEFLGDDHRQRGLDALSDLRAARADDGIAVGIDAHEHAEGGCRFSGGGRAGCAGEARGDVKREEQAARGAHAELHECPSIEGRNRLGIADKCAC